MWEEGLTEELGTIAAWLDGEDYGRVGCFFPFVFSSGVLPAFLQMA